MVCGPPLDGGRGEQHSDAPAVAFGDIVRGSWPTEFKPKSSAVFSWLMNNYWGTNFPAWQEGDYTFRYVLTSGTALDAAQANRLGALPGSRVQTAIRSEVCAQSESRRRNRCRMLPQA